MRQWFELAPHKIRWLGFDINSSWNLIIYLTIYARWLLGHD